MFSFKSRAMWTPAQFGDGKDVQKVYRQRRWIVAYQTACTMSGVEIGTRFVTCAWTDHQIDAWKADVDHAVSRYNGGVSEPSNLVLMCEHCNRVAKKDRNIGRARLAQIARAAASSYAIVQDSEFDRLWGLFPRRTGVTAPGARRMIANKRNP